MKERIVWVDIAKGILLYLVFIGHIETYGDTISIIIFSFQMAGFFILSGYTFNFESNFMHFLINKIKAILLPYFLFCSIGAIIHIIYQQWDMFGIEMLKQIFVTCMPDYTYTGAGWFLVALFFANLFMYLWCKYIEKYFSTLKIVLAFTLLYCASNILAISRSLNWERLPFKLDSAMMAFFFLLVGYYMRKNNFIEWLKKDKIVKLFIILLIYIPIMLTNGWCNIANCSYNNFIFFVIESISGTLLVIIISIYIEKIKIINTIISEIGKATLPMFMMHGMFLSYMNTHLNIHTGRDITFPLSFIYAICIISITFIIGKLYIFVEQRILKKLIEIKANTKVFGKDFFIYTKMCIQ